MQSFQSCTHAGPGIANEREACLLIAHSGSSTSTPSAAEALLSSEFEIIDDKSFIRPVSQRFFQATSSNLSQRGNSRSSSCPRPRAEAVSVLSPPIPFPYDYYRELQTSGVTEVLKILDGSFGLPSSLTHKVERAKNYIGSEPIGTLWANLSAKATDIKHIVHTVRRVGLFHRLLYNNP